MTMTNIHYANRVIIHLQNQQNRFYVAVPLLKETSLQQLLIVWTGKSSKIQCQNLHDKLFNIQIIRTRLRTHDVLIKAGEWKLGSTEEPKPFQTRRVVKITMHPAYQPTNLESDVALLHLENNLNFDKHIGPICIDENDIEPSGSANEECVTTGWGKEIIKRKNFGLSIADANSNFRNEKHFLCSNYFRSRCQSGAKIGSN